MITLIKERKISTAKKILNGGNMMTKKHILFWQQREKILIRKENKYSIVTAEDLINSYLYCMQFKFKSYSYGFCLENNKYDSL